MTRKEYLQEINECKINIYQVEKIEKIYGKGLPDIVKQMVSYSEDSIFFDDGWRTLALSEIEDAEQDLHVEFVRQEIIPVVDCGENDFIVYHFVEKIWSKFNIIDETIFKKKCSLEELF